MNRETLLFVVCVLGLAVSSSVVILLVPSLFQPGVQVSAWMLGVPGFLAVVFAAGGLHSRASRSGGDAS